MIITDSSRKDTTIFTKYSKIRSLHYSIILSSFSPKGSAELLFSLRFASLRMTSFMPSYRRQYPPLLNLPQTFPAMNEIKIVFL